VSGVIVASCGFCSMQAICWQPLAIPAHEQPLPPHLCHQMCGGHIASTWC